MAGFQFVGSLFLADAGQAYEGGKDVYMAGQRMAVLLAVEQVGLDMMNGICRDSS